MALAEYPMILRGVGKEVSVMRQRCNNTAVLLGTREVG